MVDAGPGGAASVVPDGCMDIVHGHDGDLTVAGTDTRPHEVRRRGGTVAVGLRFRTGALPRVLGVPAADLRDARVSLADVAPSLARRLDGPLSSTAGPRERIALIQAAVAHAARDAAPADPVVDGAVAALRRDPHAAVGALDTGLSERHLRRRFHAAVGYGPKTLARVLRFRRLQALGDQEDNLARLALAAGYSDQAHMTNEVKRLTGTTPRALLHR